MGVGRTSGDSGADGDLPAFVDEHRTTVAAAPDRVWASLRRYADRALATGHSSPLTKVLGTDPPAGFAVVEEEPGARLVLAGRHRFSRYRLVFELRPAAPGSTTLAAQTWADFPGPAGAAYRLLVIGSRAHVLAVRRKLRAGREDAVGRPPSPLS